MSLLADLALRIDALRRETTATDALGAILQRPIAADALAAAVKAVAPALPGPLSFTTQLADADGRPDLVARSQGREVLHIEGKFWFGFTPAQSSGAYLQRLKSQHTTHAPEHAHVGVVLFVVPPRRTAEVWAKVQHYYSLSNPSQAGEWRFASAPSGVVVAVASWQNVLGALTAIGDQALSSDCAQLLGLVDLVDLAAFVPWTEEQVGDLSTPRRVLQLAALVDSVADVAVTQKVAAHEGGRRRTKQHVLAYGRFLTLGGVPAILQISTYLWSTQGRSPIWLRFRANRDIARSAFGEASVSQDDWVSVAVPLVTDRLQDEVVESMLAWLASAADQLADAKAKSSLPVVEETASDEDAVDVPSA